MALLSWEGYKNTICDGLSALHQNGEFVDMTLAADGRQVKVHRVVMALVSPYIKQLITSANCAHPVIFLNKMKYSTLCAILEFVYKGAVHIAIEDITEFVEVSEELGIKGIEDVISIKFLQTPTQNMRESSSENEKGHLNKYKINEDKVTQIKTSKFVDVKEYAVVEPPRIIADGGQDQEEVEESAKKDGNDANQNVTIKNKLDEKSGSTDNVKPLASTGNSITKSQAAGPRKAKTKDIWLPSRARPQNIIQDETQKVYRNFRRILNNLTPNNLNDSVEKVRALGIDDQRKLCGIADLIFEKAVNEPEFCQIYAEMCAKLSTLRVTSEGKQIFNIRSLIIRVCQCQFMLYASPDTSRNDSLYDEVEALKKKIEENTDPDKKAELCLMLDKAKRLAKSRALGTISLIGEFYKLQLLTSKIIGYCMNSLIDSHNEDKWELLCKLLTCIGKEIEQECPEKLNTIYEKLESVLDNKHQISTRVRFMIKDVLELLCYY